MKRHFLTVSSRWSASLVAVLFVAGGLGSCSDEYKYETEEPDFLGASIYDYLQADGHFTYYLRLVDDLGYGQVLRLTGSKTVFPARDDAWARFFKAGNNPYGVTAYEQLTPAQKRSLLNASTINMAYLSNMLANTSNADGQSGEGTAVRRATQYSYLDSVQLTSSDIDARQFEAPFWADYKGQQLRLVDDENDAYMVHFTPQHTLANKIATEDLSLILGTDYKSTDVYVNGVRVDSANVTCKNGYLHIVSDVLTPMRPMSQVIAHNGQTNVFARQMERFSAPYATYNGRNVTDSVRRLYTGQNADYPLISDPVVYMKHYFTESYPYAPDGETDMTNYGLLYFDPSQNSYGGMQDMGVMFVPTDEAMESYIDGGKGSYLKDAYGTWDNVPSSLVALFVKNHQKKSFMTSLPSMWEKMNDESSFAMHVDRKDIVRSYVCGNGVVYVTSQVYPPIDYQCVYASVMTNAQTRIMNWALQNREMKFYLYLRSMENMYNLLVPTDEALKNYRDPISWAKGKSQRRIWQFNYDETKDPAVTADVYSVNDDGTKGEFLNTIDDASTLRNRLYDICDRHIVVGQMDADGQMSGYVDDGTRHYYQSKGGSTIRVSGSGRQMTVTGGGDQEQGVPEAKLLGHYDADNGRCYIIDRIVQDPTNSVYVALQAHPEFSKFLALLNGDERVFRQFQTVEGEGRNMVTKDDAEIHEIFTLNKTDETSGLGLVVRSFGNFQYTVLVPTNDAVDAAFAEDPTLHTWDEIAALTDVNTMRQWATRLMRFLQYHFVDNSTYVDQQPFSKLTYETAARSESGRFQKLSVSGDGQNLTFTDSQGHEAHVVKTPGLYNLQCRDFIVNSGDYRTATKMESSSQSVIHLIDRALMPE